MTRPLIGLTCYRQPARFGDWSVTADLLPSDYARSVEAAGGSAVLLPPHAADRAGSDLVGRLDGVVISGGADVDPTRYGSAAHPQTRPSSPDRDAWDFALLESAASLDLPVLGICRGMQVLAAYAGGSLEQHLPDRVGHAEHSPGPAAYGWTSVHTVPGSTVSRLVGDQVQVTCHHHQAVLSHPGLVASAHAPDGTVEAIEDVERPFWVGVQWHPENGDDHGLFLGLVEAARTRRPIP